LAIAFGIRRFRRNRRKILNAASVPGIGYSRFYAFFTALPETGNVGPVRLSGLTEKDCIASMSRSTDSLASGLLVAASAQACKSTPTSRVVHSAPTTVSQREFQHLRGRARTAEDFKALADWCRSRSEMYRKSHQDCGAEWRGYHSQSSLQSVAKHPTRGQSLKALGQHYGELSRHWEELATEYSRRARQLETDPSR
jgi:hypothetical protein